MNVFRRVALVSAGLALALHGLALPPAAPGPLKTQNVVVIVTDGLRWQEGLRG